MEWQLGKLCTEKVRALNWDLSISRDMHEPVIDCGGRQSPEKKCLKKAGFGTAVPRGLRP
ncbi:hypothetical protein PanWU01x14_064280 [Parasponia andersonii]|uniref:Uncharacterized protein n=1 Tax=Parasponia andersonii TaxID=3476 RepID=A0A2P5DH79_PARAD|nr:hypothetical protein PanWU01x14_064280 [Parasponia andersonii]